MTTYSRIQILRRLVAAAVLVTAATACNMTVTNPGPLQDDALNTPSAMPALVNGMSGNLSTALGDFAVRHGLASGEFVESGNYADEAQYYFGTFGPVNVNTDWANMQRARWTSENGLERMKTVLGSSFESNADTPRAYLYAGFANRLLGEVSCSAVIDGGPIESDSVYFQRADSLFTRAYTLATTLNNTNVKNAALAGRASVRAWLGNWTGAVADATLVPSNFIFNAIYGTGSTIENNDVATETVSRREVTVWGTQWATMFKDPRVPWDTVKTGSSITKGQDGKTNFFRQTKYTALGSSIPLVKGSEMLVLRAEAALRAGDIPGMTTLLNQARATYTGLTPLTAPATTAAAWTLLQTERGATTWLEGRRLWDLRRWYAEGTNTFLNGRNKCIPPSDNEVNSNPNLRSNK
ncbi:MAG: RagB/SusD family nutrient uptake outer membrane protein [Gemmatimonadaceae bacterium]|nr:RagB/SusD family nutrient uptake outer membrane protein [Gemmatimonadaceae bacterium]